MAGGWGTSQSRKRERRKNQDERGGRPQSSTGLLTIRMSQTTGGSSSSMETIGEQLDAVPVWIEQIDVVGMAEGVLARAKLHDLAPAELAHDITSTQHRRDVRHDVAEIVKGWPSRSMKTMS